MLNNYYSYFLSPNIMLLDSIVSPPWSVMLNISTHNYTNLYQFLTYLRTKLNKHKRGWIGFSLVFYSTCNP